MSYIAGELLLAIIMRRVTVLLLVPLMIILCISLQETAFMNCILKIPVGAMIERGSVGLQLFINGDLRHLHVAELLEQFYVLKFIHSVAR